MTRVESRKNRRPLDGVTICFDLDGTLVDTAPDLVRVTNEVIATEGLRPTDYAAARAAVGFGSRRLIIDALARADYSVDSERLDAMQAEFLDRYARTIDALSKPFPGVMSTLRELSRMGAELTVCTNKPGWLARPLLERLDMSRRFTRIVGGDEAPRAKPDPRHIFAAAGHRDRSRIVMVGDSAPDMDAARNARVFAVLALYGYSFDAPIRLRADARMRNFRDLTPALINHFTSGARSAGV